MKLFINLNGKININHYLTFILKLLSIFQLLVRRSLVQLSFL